MMKNRKRKKIFAAAVLFFSTFLLTGCASNQKNQEQSASEPTQKQDNAEQTQNNVDPTQDNAEQTQGTEGSEMTDTSAASENQNAPEQKNDVYDAVLAEYRDMVQNDFYADLRGTDSYDSSFGAHIGLEIRTHSQDVYYALYDIDGNGTDELIIAGGENGVSNPAFAPWNYDLYGYDETGVVRIFPEMEFGYRTNFSLYEGGIIEVFYSNSAAESGIDFYRIADGGTSAKLVDSFSCIGHLEGVTPAFSYYQNGTEITEQEYSESITGYESAPATPDWILIQ